MRDNVRTFVEIAARAFDLAGPVYEFGSFRVAGQEALADLRQFFPGKNYVGCDMRAGEGVDRIEDLAQLSLPDQTARTIICVDTLEHVFEARRAVDEMIRVLKPGGMLLLAAPMDFRVHDHPSDYWRLTPSCMARLLASLEATVVGWQGPEKHPHTVFGIGCKTPAPSRFLRAASLFVESFQGWLDQSAARLPPRQKLKLLMNRLLRSKGDYRRQSHYYSAHFAIDVPSINKQPQTLLQEMLGVGGRVNAA